MAEDEEGSSPAAETRQIEDIEVDSEENAMVAMKGGKMKKKSVLRPLKKQFLIFSISVLLTISSYGGLMDLQSSINISGALGNNALLLTSITTVIFCLLFTPLVVTKLGPKLTLIMSQACYLAYVIANFYPSPYTLLPGGVLLGIGEALLHTPALMYCTYHGRLAAMHNMKPEQDMINQYIGVYSGIFQMNEIFSNIISFTILGIGKKLESHSDEQSAGQSLTKTSFITTKEKLAIDSGEVSSAFLGHSNESINTSSLNSTVSTSVRNGLNATVPAFPLNSTSTANGQASFFDDDVFMNATSFFSNFSSNADKYSMCSANDCYNEDDFNSVIEHYVPLSTTAFYILVGVYTLLGISALPLMSMVPKLPSYVPVDEDSDSEAEKHEKTSNKEANSALHLVVKNVRDTFCHMVDTQQLLMTPLSLYHGMLISFVSSEINRAYISCTVGVEQVGIAMVAGGIMNVGVSFLFGGIAGRKHIRNLFVGAAITLDLSLYVFCLYWQPTDDTVWLAYIITLLFGATDGVWNPFLDGKYAKYFHENEEIAYTVHNLWCCAGYALTYGWTAVLCIRVKLYIQITVLVVGIIGFGAAELIQGRKRVPEV